MSIPNELFSGWVIQHRILRVHFSSNIARLWYIYFLAGKHFFRVLVQSLNPQTWKTRVSLYVWPLTLILSGKGDPTSSYSYTTAGIALGILEVVPEELVKTGYIQPCVKEVSEWANGTIEGNGIWKSEGVARCFKTALYIYIYIYIYIK
jgi:hypothetical protein